MPLELQLSLLEDDWHHPGHLALVLHGEGGSGGRHHDGLLQLQRLLHVEHLHHVLGGDEGLGQVEDLLWEGEHHGGGRGLPLL